MVAFEAVPSSHSFALLHQNFTVALFGRDIALFALFLGLIAAVFAELCKVKNLRFFCTIFIYVLSNRQ
jgi:hypothetical protein